MLCALYVCARKLPRKCIIMQGYAATTTIRDNDEFAASDLTMLLESFAPENETRGARGR